MSAPGNNWHTEPLTGFDLETSGLNVDTARIVTASILCYNPATNMARTIGEWLVDPSVAIPAEATAVHGVTTNHARLHGSPSQRVLPIIRDVLVEAAMWGMPVVVFNAAYDLTVLDRECRRHDLPTLHERCAQHGVQLTVIDPLVIDWAVAPSREGHRSLMACCAHYGVPLVEAHTSRADALAATQLAVMIGRETPEITDDTATPERLMEWQATWHARWLHAREHGCAPQEADTTGRDWPVQGAA